MELRAPIPFGCFSQFPGAGKFDTKSLIEILGINE